MGLSGISTSFEVLSQIIRQIIYALLTRAPLNEEASSFTPFDLHVLGTPPAFVLSQDQTLQLISGFGDSVAPWHLCHPGPDFVGFLLSLSLPKKQQSTVRFRTRFAFLDFVSTNFSKNRPFRAPVFRGVCLVGGIWVLGHRLSECKRTGAFF